MKKVHKQLLSLVLAFLILIPITSIAENAYSPKLGMTIEDFIRKYNAVPASLESPYKPLKDPLRWSNIVGFQMALFHPEENSSIALILMTQDPTCTETTKAGLDMISIVSNSKENWIPLISITKRCTSIFTGEVLGISTASSAIVEVISHYYENGLEKTDSRSYRSLNDNPAIALTFGSLDSSYAFAISSTEDAK